MRYDISALSTSSAPSKSTMNSWVAARADQTAVQQTAFAYDARGNLLQETSTAAFAAPGSPSTAEGLRRIDYRHDQAGRLIQRTEANRNSEQFVYDGLGRLTASVDIHGGRTTIAFDDVTRTIVTLANGHVRTSTYDKTGELVAYTEAGELMPTGTATTQYDKVGRPRIVTDANGIKRYALYDKVGRRIADVSQAGELTEYRYDANDRLVATARFATKLSAAALAQVADPASTVEMAAIRPTECGGRVDVAGLQRCGRPRGADDRRQRRGRHQQLRRVRPSRRNSRTRPAPDRHAARDAPRRAAGGLAAAGHQQRRSHHALFP
ncbi:hypothetical protein AB5I41_22905 [Sphingomonas sp. MMS24-JH45]